MILSPYLEELQKYHQFQASSNDCGPFCSAMILNTFYERDVSGEDLAVEMNRYGRKGILPLVRRVPDWATFPWGIADVLQKENLVARWKVLYNIYDLFEDLERDHISIVIVGGFRPLWSHYKILAAHDAVKGWGFVNPASRNGDLQWDKHVWFQLHWGKYGRQVIQVGKNR